MNDTDRDIKILESHDIEEKMAAQDGITARVATRKFLEESCELAKMLPPRKKCLFIMRYSNGFSIKEIAELCKVDETEVGRQLKRIANQLNEMRKCCNGKGTHESPKERLKRNVQWKNRNRSIGSSKYIAGTLPEVAENERMEGSV